VRAARPRLSIVTPAFDEAANLEPLYARLCAALDDVAWEWIVVDDHSRDRTFAVVQTLASVDARVSGVRLARNAGSHAACRCGLSLARGEAVALLMADGQDPPEALPALVEAWAAGAQVVWAARAEGVETLPWSSRLAYRVLRRIPGLQRLAPDGADCVLLDRVVVDALAGFREQHVNMLALVAWLGFRQTSVPVRRAPRRHGRSGWTPPRRLAVFVDTIVAFSFAPIRVLSALGVLTALGGFAYLGVVLANAWRGAPPDGWSSLMVVVLLVGGLQMAMLGVLGEYLWRALEDGRRRPAWVIEDVARSQLSPEEGGVAAGGSVVSASAGAISKGRG
jgi:polyisoprenyl-phosphate glycosyltransferase